MPSIARPPKIKIAIDRGGTFTDCLGISESKGNILVKLLSVDPANYPDAPTEGIRRILEWFTESSIPRGQLIDLSRCEFIRMGTTVATNALLERKGERHALLTTAGFKDVIVIGNQTRPKLFDLAIKRPDVLYEKVVEIDERAIVEWSELVEEGAEVSVDGHKLVKGTSGDVVRIITPLDKAEVRTKLQALYDEGFRSLAIVFMHSFTFRDHEIETAKIAEEIGFEHISQSSDLQAMIRIVPRANSASADAYLTPEIRRYLSQFAKGFVGHLEDETCQVSFMQSDGSLVDHRHFSGLRAILSGPAGGVVGYAQTSYDAEEGTPVVGFDMGGTSTDVSRYGGKLEHVFETTTAGVTIQSPQLDISTVAAGGGSMLFYRNGLFVVGPDSAGAHPGPACYRKGGPLTVTDANLFLGRLHIDSFPKIFGKTENLPLDYEASAKLFIELTRTINAESGQNLTPEAVASGFIDVANETMARPIRGLTEARGYSTQDHSLSCFGGAGGQHASAIASTLNIHNVIVHKYSSVLSAYGMALADVAVDLSEPSSETFNDGALERILPKVNALKVKALSQLEHQGVLEDNIYYEVYLNLRYLGSDTSMMIMEPKDGDFARQFKDEHRREFSFNLDKPLIVDDIRVRGVGKSPELQGAGSANFAKDLQTLSRKPVQSDQAFAVQKMYFPEIKGWVDAPVYRLGDLEPGTEVQGPSLVLDNTQTLVVHPTNTAIILNDHVYIDVGLGPKKQIDTKTIDPILLSVFGSRFMSIAEQMGRTLQKTSISLQIKERLDFSCAVFDGNGDLIANAPAVPVHLGAMSYAVSFQAKIFEGRLKPGDIIVSNMPTAGGSHLPDITVICPVFQDGEIVFWTAARAHHGDIGGLYGNSMPPESTELVQEGARIYAHLLVSDGKFDEEGIKEIFEEAGNYPNCLAARRFQDNLSDLKAQVSACAVGSAKIQDLFQEYSKDVVLFYMKGIRLNAEVAVRAFLQQVHKARNGKPLQAIDYMDDGTPINLTITINPADGGAIFDFEGTGPEGYHNLNAPSAVAKSAILYCLRCLIGIDIPLNSGCLAPLDVQIPPGTIISPSEHVACSSGNTETSQRVTDVVFKAFEATAASQGCMNVFQANYKDLAYGETICGGHGAGKTWVGTSGVHINMTNTKMTDAEIFEKRFPVILRKFGIREGSGGAGMNKGGDGVHREFEFIVPTSAAVIGERRVNAPYGMHGGMPGERGCAYWMRKNQDGTLRKTKLKPSQTINASRGERLIIHTPGGGGYGTPLSAEAAAANEVNGTHPVVATKETTKVFWPRANGSIAAYQAASEASQ